MALVAEPDTKAFASTAHGSTATQEVTLTPDASSDSIFAVVVTGEDADQFTVTETYDEPPSGVPAFGISTVVRSVSTFTITYAPSAAGTHAAVVEVHYNGVAEAATLRIPVSGTAT